MTLICNIEPTSSMITKVFSILSLLFISFTYGQVISISGNFRFSPPQYLAEVKDTAQILVGYEMKAVKDPRTPTKITEGSTVLEIGPYYFKFADVNRKRLDSLDQIFSTRSYVGQDEVNLIFKSFAKFRPSVLVDSSGQRVFIKDRYGREYEYSEELPRFSWILKDGEEKILGYVCKRAALEFRGRKWNAWYAPELPFSAGPYFFGGLPGLILKMEDSQKHYQFLATGIEKKSEEIIWRNEPKIQKISRENFMKIKRNYHENPGLFLSGGAYDANGEEISPKMKSKPYNPIELK